jgi:hypothetical protein
MAYGKFGFPSMVSKASSNKGAQSLSSGNKNYFLVRVTQVNLDSSLPPSAIGSISGEIIDANAISSGKIIPNITPSDPYRTIVPLVNEYVWVRYIINPNSFGGQYVYDSPLSMYGIASVNINPNPSPTSKQTLPPSQQLNYSQVENGAYNVVDNNSINLNSTSNFSEKGNIHPLLPYTGDVIYEGRWGQSIRFSSTLKTSNPWSTAGTDGDPITILRNGQDPNSSDFGAEPITENIKNDLSSIYLTSHQQLPFSIANENFISYTTPPITPSQFTNSQIILNSDRIILNAKSDSVLISGEKSVGISSNGSVNIDAVSHYISSNDIKLGSKNATQPVLLGDNTVEILIQLTEAIKSLASILQVQRDYPGGVLATSYNAIAGNILNQINDPSNGILAQLNNNSLKSQTTKVQ